MKRKESELDYTLFVVYIENKWRQKNEKTRNSEGCITKDSRGKWIARLQIGYNSNGNPRIKTFSGNTPTEARRRMNNLRKILRIWMV